MARLDPLSRAAVSETGRIESDLLSLEVARLFFERQLPKTEIAKRLGISRFRVARILDDALARGLVTIQFREVVPLDRERARAIEERYGLDLCLVVRGVAGEPGASLAAVGSVAAATLDDLIGPEEIVGVSWGSSVAATVEAVRPRTLPGVRVVQLAGGSARVGAEHNPSELARRLAARLGARLHALYAPTFVESRALRDALLGEPEVRATTDLFEQVTLALVGIGALVEPAEGQPTPSALIASGVLGAAEVARLRAAGAVGDLILYPVAADGRFVASDLAERAVAIGAEQLRRVPRVMAVAAGAAKGAAIAGVLASGAVDFLVTDEAAARGILGEPGVGAG